MKQRIGSHGKRIPSALYKLRLYRLAVRGAGAGAACPSFHFSSQKLVGADGELGAVANPELFEDCVQVDFHRALGDAQFAGNLPVAQAAADETDFNDEPARFASVLAQLQTPSPRR